MKILAIHRFYWPDTPPYASILRKIVCQWVADGHNVDVLSSQPSYKKKLDNPSCPPVEMVDGAKVYRMNLPNETGRPLAKVINAIRLGFRVLWQGCIKNKYDIIMISTYPPVIGGLFAALTAKITGARFIYHCMDIHPEIGSHSGEFKNYFVFSILSKIDQWSCKHADPVIVLSNDMSSTLKNRSARGKPNCLVLNNFSLPSELPLVNTLPFNWPSEEFVILFAGNVGRFQGLDALIKAMAILNYRTDICLLIMGDGTEKERLLEKSVALDAHVYFVGHHEANIAKFAMQRAQVGYIGLTPQLYRYAYPSKTMTYLENGCPILLAVEEESCISKSIVNSKSGISIIPGDSEMIANTILDLVNNPKRLADMRLSAYKLALNSFNTNGILEQWSYLIKK